MNTRASLVNQGRSRTTTYMAVMEFYVPSKYVSRLIGVKGCNVTDIKQKTSTRISFIANPSDDNDNQLCRIDGQTDDVEDAKAEIQKQLVEYESAVKKAHKMLQERKIRLGITESLETEHFTFELRPEDKRNYYKTIREMKEGALEKLMEPKLDLERQKRLSKVCQNCGEKYTGQLKKHVAESEICSFLTWDNDDIAAAASCLTFTRKVRPKLTSPIKSSRKSSVSKMKPSKGVRVSAGSADFNCDVQTCPYDMPFYSRVKLEGHYKKVHANLHIPMAGPKDPKAAPPFRRSCEGCLKDFHDPHAYIKHTRASKTCRLKMIHDDLGIAKKSKTFRRVPKLDDDNECRLCEAGLYLLGSKEFKKHIQSAHGKYSCSFCDAVFNRNDQLLAHGETHAEECSRSYNFKHPMCKFCGETFEVSWKLKQHIRNNRLLCARKLCTCVVCSGSVGASTGSSSSDRDSDSDNSDTIPRTKSFARTRTFSVMNDNYELVIGGPEPSITRKKKKSL